MMRAAIVILALALPAVGQVRGFSAAATRCGTDQVFRVLCGFGISPAAALSAPTSVNAGDTISSSGNYILAASGAGNITITAESVSFDGGSTAGRVLTGRVIQTSNANNLTIQNLEANCNHADAGDDAGCIRAKAKTAATGPIIFWNVKVRNSNAAGRNIHTSADGGATYGGAGKQVRGHFLDLLSPSAPAATRWTNFSATGIPGSAEMHDSRNICAADTQACQVFICFSTPNCDASYNYTATLAGSVTNTSRHFTADAQNASCAFGTADGFRAYYNDMDIFGHRGFRIRCADDFYFYLNLLNNVEQHPSNYIAAVHSGDADAGEDQPNINVQGWNNRITITNGTVLMTRNASGTVLTNNPVTCIGSCSAGKFAQVRTPVAPGTTSEATIVNNPSVATAGFSTQNTAEASATLNRCNSGNAGGAGTNNVISCP